MILGDCLEHMQSLPDNHYDLVLTDPPYGLGISQPSYRTGNGQVPPNKGASDWDQVPDPIYFDEMIRISRHQIIWGGNLFADMLPANRGWLVWDKMTGNNTFSDAELAWTSLDQAIRMYKLLWLGSNAKDTPTRLHPTQKPVSLMEWCLGMARPKTVYDPYAGSGTTGVACLNLGLSFVGNERDPIYYEIAQARLQQAASQLILQPGQEHRYLGMASQLGLQLD